MSKISSHLCVTEKFARKIKNDMKAEERYCKIIVI